MKFDLPRIKAAENRFLEVIPLANCVLILLVFLMLMRDYSVNGAAGISVILPKAITSEVAVSNAATITITREKVLYFGTAPVSSKELSSKLEALGDKGSVLVKADKGTSLERVVEVWDICRRAGIRQVNIATTQPK